MSAITAHEKTEGNDEWLTPPYILESLGVFDLDPCSPINRPWPTALNHFNIKDNGLKQDWFGRVWLNPPYGNETKKWLQKLVEHNNGIALIFARTETVAFTKYVWEKASGLLFLPNRLNFYDVFGNKSKSNAGAPSVLVAYGVYNSHVLKNCELNGYFIPGYAIKIKNNKEIKK